MQSSTIQQKTLWSALWKTGQMEHAISLWLFGDWEGLVQIDDQRLQMHPDRGTLALLVAAGHLQCGNPVKAKALILLAKDAGCPKHLVSRILISGIHNSLARALSRGGAHTRALEHYKTAVQLGEETGQQADLLPEIRVAHEYRKQGLPPPHIDRHQRRENERNNSTTEAEYVIENALSFLPNDPSLRIASAENAMREGNYEEAIRRWQALMALDTKVISQAHYDRLELAYEKQHDFPKGTPDEEVRKGDGVKHDILARLHQLLSPRLYFEIGVCRGKSLALANCKAIGVDPMPNVGKNIRNQALLIRKSSDDFFANDAAQLLKTPIDFAFIDGMHLFEFVLRDFINVERYSHPGTIIVIDDILPCHPAQAERSRRTWAWTGDVWKILFVLRRYRPDLQLITLNVNPTGLLIIKNINPKSVVLQGVYEDIINEYKTIDFVPDEVISRCGVISCENGWESCLAN